MYYVYTISIKGKVIYIGQTYNPIYRYRQHYTSSSCAAYLRHHLITKRAFSNLTIVYFSNNLDRAKAIEYALIKEAFKTKECLFNSTRSVGIDNYSPKFKEKLTNTRLTNVKAYVVINKGISRIEDQLNKIANNTLIPLYNLIPYENAISLIRKQ